MRSKVAAALVAAVGLGMAQGAYAADMPVKAAKALPPAPSSDWTGAYIGVNVGYGLGEDPTTMSTVSGAGFPLIGGGVPLYGAPRDFTLRPDGFIGGLQIGYNYQFAPHWVAGVETDFQGSGMKDSASCLIACGSPIVTTPTPAVLIGYPVVFSDLSAEHKVDWFGTVRGRIGYTASPTLFYFTGGLAYGDVKRSGSVAGSTIHVSGGGPAPLGTAANSFAGSYSASTTKVGWTIGGGVEAKWFANWSVKAEYLYIDLGKVTDTFNTTFTYCFAAVYCPLGLGSPAGVRTDSSDIRLHVFRVGLNYQFSMR